MNRYNKYKVAKKEDRTLDGIVFASKKEMTRYDELKKLEKAGEITDLELQPKFPCLVNGQKICDYVADFRYYDKRRGEVVVEDSKGFATSMYRLKKKLVRAVHGVEIVES